MIYFSINLCYTLSEVYIIYFGCTPLHGHVPFGIELVFQWQGIVHMDEARVSKLNYQLRRRVSEYQNVSCSYVAMAFTY